MNLTIQGLKVTYIDWDEAVSAPKNKLLLWKKFCLVAKGSAACFSNLDRLLENDYNQNLIEVIGIHHLNTLNENFER